MGPGPDKVSGERTVGVRLWGCEEATAVAPGAWVRRDPRRRGAGRRVEPVYGL